MATRNGGTATGTGGTRGSAPCPFGQDLEQSPRASGLAVESARILSGPIGGRCLALRDKATAVSLPHLAMKSSLVDLPPEILWEIIDRVSEQQNGKFALPRSYASIVIGSSCPQIR